MELSTIPQTTLFRGSGSGSGSGSGGGEREGLVVARMIQGTGAGEVAGQLDRAALTHALTEHRAVSGGAHTVDTADVWGTCEATIGEFIESTRYGAGGRTVVLTRYTPEARYRISKEDVRAALRRACQRLGLERLDLVQLVWRDFRVRHYVETARHLAELSAEGLASGFGVCDFDVARLRELEQAGVAVDTVQVPFSLIDRRPERGVERNSGGGGGGGGGVESLLAYCRGRGIAVLARGVLAGGWLSESFIGHRTPQRDVHLPSVSLTRYLPILDELSLGSGRPGSSDWADWCKRWTLYQQLLLALEAVALKHGCTVANVAARWVMDKPGVAAILVGARDASHVLDNLRTFDVRLDAEDVALIERILEPMEGPRGDCGQLERKRGN